VNWSRFAKGHAWSGFEHLKGWRVHNVTTQPGSSLQLSSQQNIFPLCLNAISSISVCAHCLFSMGAIEKGLALYSLPPPSDVSTHGQDHPEPSLVQAEQFSQSLTLCQRLQSLHHLCDSFLHYVCLVLGSPEFDPALQIMSHQCSAEEKNHLPQPAGKSST